jgi:hypothetical protein
MIREMLGATRQGRVLGQLQCGVDELRNFPIHWHRARVGYNNLQMSQAPRGEYT